MTPRAILVGCCLAAAIGAACGGSDTGTGATGPGGSNDATVDAGSDAANDTLAEASSSSADGGIETATTDATTTDVATADEGGQPPPNDASIDTGSADGGPDAGPTGDSMPTGAITFFKRASCPTGWAAYAPGAGRFVVPSPGGTGAGATAGAALTGGNDVPHGHSASASVTLATVSFAGLAAGSNLGPAAGTTTAFSLTLDGATTALPWVQLLLCEKRDAPRAATAAIPSGTTIFYASDACPSGWSEATGSRGRFLVGTPNAGTSGATFGGAPLTALEQRGHSHAVSGVVKPPAAGIALASGCCGDGYGASGDDPFSATSSAAVPSLPYVQLTQCAKN